MKDRVILVLEEERRDESLARRKAKERKWKRTHCHVCGMLKKDCVCMESLQRTMEVWTYLTHRDMKQGCAWGYYNGSEDGL